MTDRLLDTNALSAFMKSTRHFQQFVSRMADDDSMFTSVIAEGEIRFGISRLPAGRKKTNLILSFDRVLTEIDEVLPVTRKVAARYAEMKDDLWSRGKPTAENDLWIAATALCHDLVLVTSDAVFKAVSGLSVEDWSH